MSTGKHQGIAPEKLALYQRVLATIPGVSMKGATNPYTSHNGNMFTHLVPPGSLAIRLAPDDVEPFLRKYKTSLLESYGVVKRDWVVVPDALLKKTSELQKYVEASYRYVKTLKPKATTRKK